MYSIIQSICGGEGVKSNPIFGFHIPTFPIYCVTFRELSKK